MARRGQGFHPGIRGLNWFAVWLRANGCEPGKASPWIGSKKPTREAYQTTGANVAVDKTCAPETLVAAQLRIFMKEFLETSMPSDGARRLP